MRKISKVIMIIGLLLLLLVFFLWHDRESASGRFTILLDSTA